METLTRYDLVQMSDDYEFDASSDDIATVAVALLGNGVGWQRPARDGDDTDEEAVTRLPSMEAMFAEGEKKKQVEEEMKQLLEVVLDDHRQELIDALRTIEIRPDKRRKYGVDPEVWHDGERTSLADYREAAQELAANLEKVEADSSTS